MKRSHLLGFVLLFFSAHAWADSLTGQLTIDLNSYFGMGSPVPTDTSAPLSAGSDGGILLGTHQSFVLDPDEPHPDGHPDAPFGAGS